METKRTPQQLAMLGMNEPVYAVATRVYNASTAGRLVVGSTVEAFVKNGYPPQTRLGFMETVQSSLARPRATVEIVQAQMSNTGTSNLIPEG
jgi:hypothetical protein